MVPALLAAALAAAPAAHAAPTPAPKAALPNIVLIVADDLGVGEIEPYGQTQIRTPRLARMAAEGMKFTQFSAGSCVCAPSRCTLMTGLHSGHTRVRDNDVGALRAADVTVAEVLKAAGYATGFFGKWGLSKEGRVESYPTRQGFDAFFGYRDQTHAHNPWPEFLWRGETKVSLRNVVPGAGPEGEGVAFARVEWAPELIARESMEFIRAHRSGPFFVCLAGPVPHINNEAADGPDGGFEAANADPYAGSGWPRPKASYAALVSALDAQAGGVLDLLDHLDLSERTLVLFTSDNGPTPMRSVSDGRTDVIGRWFSGSEPLAGFKHDLREGGLRVPLIARWKGTIAPGSISDAPAYFPDLMPTFAALAGAPPPARTDGVDIGPILRGRSETVRREDPLIWSYPDRNQHAVRSGRWKGYWIDGTAHLYDLEADPRETTDVARAHPGILARLDAARVAANRPAHR